MNILYASDLDRTIIYSKKFIDEYNTGLEAKPVEYKEDKVVSYIDSDVYDELHKIVKNESISFVPVTSRSSEEYHRIDLGFTPEYAIIANGGVILHNGEVLDEWNKYVKSKIKHMEILDMLNLFMMEFSSVNSVRAVDGCYIFCKTSDPLNFDMEVHELQDMIPKNWHITRQNNKVYVIPDHISKQIALRWLWHKLKQPYIVASGDGLLDLGMLSLANKAIIPSHGIILEEHVESATVADGGIKSPLFTFNVLKDLVKE